MKSFYSKKFKITFNRPDDPNLSMGDLLVFCKQNGDPVAHLGITWQSKLWFGYHDGRKWKDITFPFRFNSFQYEKSKSYCFDFVLNGNKIIWKQSNLINSAELSRQIKFDHVKVMQDFNLNEPTSINENKIEFLNSILVQEISSIATPVKDFDIIIIGYKSLEFLPLCLENLIGTYLDSDINKPELKKIIYCDNNQEKIDIKKSKNIIDSIKLQNKLPFELVYVKNNDNRYCSNRLTATKLALEKSQSEVVTLLDSDVIMLNSLWLETYSYLYDFGPAVGCSTLDHSRGGGNTRDSSIILHRILPFFSHFRSNFLKKSIKEDQHILNDFKIETNYKNITMGLMGFHFSKLFLDILSNKCLFYVMDHSIDYDWKSNHPVYEEDDKLSPHMKYIPSEFSKYYKPGFLHETPTRTTPPFLKHIEGLSFKEFLNDKISIIKFKTILFAIEDYISHVNYDKTLSKYAIKAVRHIRLLLKNMGEEIDQKRWRIDLK